MRDEGTHQVAMVRLHNYLPARPDCAPQGSEDCYIFIVCSISKRGEDIARDIETRFWQGRPQIMPLITQPLQRQFPSLALRQGQHGLRLIHAEHLCPEHRKRTGETSPTARRIQEPTPWV